MGALADEVGRRWRRVVDLAVYAPLGLFAVVAERIGEQFGRHDPDAPASSARPSTAPTSPANSPTRIAALAGRAEPPATDAGVGSEQDVPPSPSASARPSPDRDGLAIDEYDSLAASQIVDRLAALTADELRRIDAFEATHRQRRTVLGKVAQLLAGRS